MSAPARGSAVGTEGTHEYPLAPLALPAADIEPVEALTGYLAIVLFVERATAAKPAFALTAKNARAYSDVASVRGVGLSLIGLAATEAAEHQPARAIQLATAAEIYAHQEGIVNVYSDETPGREFVDQARAALADDEAARATALGRTLTTQQALDLARSDATDSGGRLEAWASD